jgi:hypothetical protein
MYFKSMVTRQERIWKLRTPLWNGPTRFRSCYVIRMACFMLFPHRTLMCAYAKEPTNAPS